MAKDVHHARLEFTPEQHQRLRLAAATRGLSMTAFIRETVLQAIEKTLSAEKTAHGEEAELPADPIDPKEERMRAREERMTREVGEMLNHNEERRRAVEERMTREVKALFDLYGYSGGPLPDFSKPPPGHTPADPGPS
jgi:hypothetical protein